jgi:hypothetical protein
LIKSDHYLQRHIRSALPYKLPNRSRSGLSNLVDALLARSYRIAVPASRHLTRQSHWACLIQTIAHISSASGKSPGVGLSNPKAKQLGRDQRPGGMRVCPAGNGKGACALRFARVTNIRLWPSPQDGHRCDEWTEARGTRHLFGPQKGSRRMAWRRIIAPSVSTRFPSSRTPAPS